MRSNVFSPVFLTSQATSGSYVYVLLSYISWLFYTIEAELVVNIKKRCPLKFDKCHSSSVLPSVAVFFLLISWLCKHGAHLWQTYFPTHWVFNGWWRFTFQAQSEREKKRLGTEQRNTLRRITQEINPGGLSVKVCVCVVEHIKTTTSWWFLYQYSFIFNGQLWSGGSKWKMQRYSNLCITALGME